MTEKKSPPNKKEFTPEMAEMVIELGKQGASQKTMYAMIGISQSTASKWKKENEAFAEAMDLATVHGQSYWETMLLANIDNKGFNSRIAEIALRGQYPDDYRENRNPKIDLKADTVKIDFGKEVSDLIEALKKV